MSDVTYKVEPLSAAACREQLGDVDQRIAEAVDNRVWTANHNIVSHGLRRLYLSRHEPDAIGERVAERYRSVGWIAAYDPERRCVNLALPEES